MRRQRDADEPVSIGLFVTHSEHAARTEGGYNLVVRAGKVRLRRLPVNRHGVAHAADCGMAGEDRLGAIRASI